MNEKCQVFTPPNYVEKLLDAINYKDNLYRKKILENSCGDGNILVAIVKRYIIDCRKHEMSNTKIRNGLTRDIVGYEIDRKHYTVCIEKLNNLLKEYNINPINWTILNKDYLRNDDKRKYDFIVGNPPYLTYKELTKTEQDFLRKNYSVCEKGKFDYCYAFIEKSLTELKKDGKMSYLIPSSIFKTVFGQALRDKMKDYIVEIIEYTQQDIFDKVLIKSAIIVLNKNRRCDVFKYSDSNDMTPKDLYVDTLLGKWQFSRINEGKNRFGDYFKVAHVVATLLNEAFVIQNNSYEVDEKYIRVNNFLIEKEIVRVTETPRTKQFEFHELIIFPYYYTEGVLCRYTPEEFKKSFPRACEYLDQFKEKLKDRKVDKNVNWFEYGRSQALKKINVEKLLISTIVSNKVTPYFLTAECIPYAGMFIVPKERKDGKSLQEAYTMLTSKEFYEYVQNIGIHINGNSVRITSKDIENYIF